MLTTFQVKNSTIELNGVDISGLSNTVEVTISAKTDKKLNEHLNGKLDVSIRQKMFLKESSIEEFINTCNLSLGSSYRFTRECLEYTVDNIDLTISKQDPIAGVVPIELLIGGDTLPQRKRI
jgi:hypothetical protein